MSREQGLINRRILIIDDEPAIHKDFRKILVSEEDRSDIDALEARLFGTAKALPSTLSFVLDSSFQGLDGFERVITAHAQRQPYALVFVDVRMPPGWDGVETLRRIFEEEPYVQAVLCTAYSDYHWNEVCDRLQQFDRFIILKKPFEPIEVRQIAAALTERWSKEAALRTVLSDLTQAMHTALTISSEVMIERVIEQFLRTSCVSAAARRAVFILIDGDGIAVAGEATATSDEVRVTGAGQLASATELPLSVVRQVAHRREVVVLEKSNQANPFSEDPYFRDHCPELLLCMPLIHQGRLTGVLYLESDTVGGLRHGLVNLLQMLASQVVSALENAHLYRQLRQSAEKLARANDHLESEVAKRTAELHDANQRLVQLEKEATELQMAGGFAHEMRNALAGAKLVLAAGYRRNGNSLCIENLDTLKELVPRLGREMSKEGLGSIAGLLRKLSSNEERLDRILSVTDDAVGRALHITNAILEYSKLGSEQAGEEDVAVRPLVESILTEVTAEFEAHGITMRVDIVPELTLRGKDEHFASIFRHLLRNGCDALVDPAGAAPRELLIEGVNEPDRAVLRISDTGAGIDPKDRDHIFTPFFSTRPTTRIGLGLGMVEKLVRLYRGAMSVESELGRGTTLTIEFPTPSGV